MARIQMNVGAPVVSVDVIIPEYTAGSMQSKESFYGQPKPVLWLFHDHSGGHSDWVRYTRIELYAQQLGVIVVCPHGHQGFYRDWPAPAQTESAVLKRLWRQVRELFPISKDRNDTYLAGVGRGGYEAARFAFDHPDEVCAVGVLQSSNGEVCTDWLRSAEENAGAAWEFPLCWFGCSTQFAHYQANRCLYERLGMLDVRAAWYECKGPDDWFSRDLLIGRFLNFCFDPNNGRNI
ncbi:MAG: hypothetical protein ACI3XJ_01245 [Oscillospiraceae bacterium]